MTVGIGRRCDLPRGHASPHSILAGAVTWTDVAGGDAIPVPVVAERAGSICAACACWPCRCDADERLVALERKHGCEWDFVFRSARAVGGAVPRRMGPAFSVRQWEDFEDLVRNLVERQRAEICDAAGTVERERGNG